VRCNALRRRRRRRWFRRWRWRRRPPRLPLFPSFRRTAKFGHSFMPLVRLSQMVHSSLRWLLAFYAARNSDLHSTFGTFMTMTLCEAWGVYSSHGLGLTYSPLPAYLLYLRCRPSIHSPPAFHLVTPCIPHFFAFHRLYHASSLYVPHLVVHNAYAPLYFAAHEHSHV
jgi:hypothetical protein